MHSATTSIHCDKIKNNCDYLFYSLFLFFMLFMIIQSDINKLVSILFVHLSSIILENFMDRALIIPEILELIELHTYKLDIVYIQSKR